MPSLRERFDARTRRALTFYGYGLGLVVLAGIVLGFVVSWSQSKSDDRLAVITNWLAGGTLALAFVAGLVALQAYANASGLPDLMVRFKMPSAHPNEPRVVVGKGLAYSHSVSFEQAQAAISVRNFSLYAAKSPAMLIELENLEIVPGVYTQGSDWTVVELGSANNITAMQWDGPAPIHGKSERRIGFSLPQLRRTSATMSPAIQITLMADGYEPRKVRLEVEFTEEGTPGKPPSELSKTPEWL